MRQGILEPGFYGDLVFKLKKIVGSNNFSAQFIKMISHYKRISFNINVLQQTACFVVNPIMVGSFAFLFNCTLVGRTSDSMTVPTLSKTLLQQGISEPLFYGDLVYKFKRIVGKPNFSDQFKKIVIRYIRFGYNLDIMRLSACLVLNPITVYSYGFLFNCTTVGQASDSMMALM